MYGQHASLQPSWLAYSHHGWHTAIMAGIQLGQYGWSMANASHPMGEPTLAWDGQHGG